MKQLVGGRTAGVGRVMANGSESASVTNEEEPSLASTPVKGEPDASVLALEGDEFHGDTR